MESKCWSAMDFDIICPPLLLIVVLMFATIGPIATSFSLIFVLPVLLFFIRKYYSERNQLKQSRFFLSWSISSLIILICVFELEVVPYLEILFVENLTLILLTTSTLISVMIIRKNELKTHINSELNIYNYWIRSTVSQKSFVIYVLSQVLASMALIYGSHLTLTTICHSTLVYQTVLIPDDCSEVYFDNEIKTCFVCAIYSIQISICIIFFLFKRLFNRLLKVNKPVVKYIRLDRIES